MKRAKSGIALRSAVTGISLLAMTLAGCGSPEEKSESLYKSGMALIAKNDDLAARVDLLKALKYRADKVEVWRALAGIDERTNAQSLFLDLRRIVEIDPNDLDARLKLAKLMLKGGATDAASKVIELAREGDKPNAELHSLKATVLARSNDLVGALREANRAIAIDPNNVDATTLIASRKFADRDFDGALKSMQDLSGYAAEDLRVRQIKVQILAQKGELKEAEMIQRGIVAEKLNDSAPRLQLVQIMIARGELLAAEAELRVQAAVDPKDTKAALDVVRFLTGSKGRAAGRAELDSLIKKGGDVFEYLMALTDFDIAESKFDDAIKRLQDLIASEISAERKTLAQVKLAEIYVGRGDFAAGDPIVAQILAIDRRNIGGLKLRAIVKIERKDIDSAVADLREALNDQPKSSDLLLLLAKAYESGGKLELADRQYADAIKASNSDNNVVGRYVNFLKRRDDLERADSVLLEAATRNPRNSQILQPLAQLRLARRDWMGARVVADMAARNDDGRAFAEEVRAAAFAGEGKTDESVAALEKVHQVAPDAIDPVASLIAGYVRQNQPDKAATLVQDMLKKFPDNAQLLVLSGQVNLSKKNDDQAVKDFQTAIKRQPKNPIGYAALSDFQARQNQPAAAIGVLEVGLREQPNVGLQMSLASLLITSGKPDLAIQQYEAVLKVQPQQQVAINNLVSLSLDTPLDKDALDRIATLAEPLKTAQIREFRDTYGWMQYKRGDYRGAIDTLEKVAAQAGKESVVRFHLGMAYQAVGDTQKSADELKAALQLEPNNTPLRARIQDALQNPGKR